MMNNPPTKSNPSAKGNATHAEQESRECRNERIMAKQNKINNENPQKDPQTRTKAYENVI